MFNKLLAFKITLPPDLGAKLEAEKFWRECPGTATPGPGNKIVYDIPSECLEIGHLKYLLHQYIDLFFWVTSIVAIIFLIWGGILYLTAYGNEERANTGKKTIYWAIAGLAIALLAKVFVAALWKMLT